MTFRTKLLCVMKITAVLLLVAALHASAHSDGQTVTLQAKEMPLETAIAKLRQQTGFLFIYNDKDMARTRPVTLHLANATLPVALTALFRDQPLTFEIQQNTVFIVIRPQADAPPAIPVPMPPPPADIHGRVTDSSGAPLSGASVFVKGTKKGVQTDGLGNFDLKGVEANGTIIVSFAGYQPAEIKLNGRNSIDITLSRNVSSLDQVQIIAYGTTTERLNTGNVSTVKAEDIEKQPVANVLFALSGRVAGVFVQTTNGLPGGNTTISIRGKGSILAGTDPLYVIDGVPFASSVVPSQNIISTGTINGVISPFNSLNPADIESITILKDADATAIYGSRGTNGVVLITTKKGKAGATRADATFSQGISRLASYPKLQNLEQYLTMRREAFVNDGQIPSSDGNSPNYAPDLTTWDTTRSTDWVKYCLGGTGHVNTGQLGISGGNANTNFNVSGNYRVETTVLPGSNLYQRGGLYINLQHTSSDNKFTLLVTSSYTADKNVLVNPRNDISFNILLPPNCPIYDASGNYNWVAGVNPKADLKATSKTSTDNLIGNLSLKYTLLPGLNVKISAGYNKINIDQTEIYPAVSLYPGSVNYSNFGLNSNQSYIIEPQIEYNRKIRHLRMSLLAGSTYQDRISQGQTIEASNFTNESLMENFSSAGTIAPYNSYTLYKYESVFGRATLNWEDKYILNGTIRRDGSSRFGPGNQFGNFGSIGGAWLFSNEKWMKHNASFLSYGKLRSSYGLTGNDQITDYQFLSSYGSSSSFNYQDSSALRPSRIANADFHWETTRKLEFAVELGFLQDRILMTLARYQNQSNDQLVNYTVPRITGFSSYEANLPAAVQNTGWEFELNTKNIQTKSFSWSTTFNITLPRNRLKSFDNFSNSSYSQTLQLGYDITRIYGYRSLGVDPATGVASYAPQPGGTSTDPYYYFTMGKHTPDFYGGFGNTFTYKGWQLDIFGQFAQQKAVGGLTYPPGFFTNNYALVNARWQYPGEKTNIPKASNQYTDFYYTGSNSNYFNASYFRVKNVALYYRFSAAWLKKAGLGQLAVFAQAQNLLTFWNRNVPLLDPESGSLTYASNNIPPMRSFSGGVQISF